jgi:hypothetical protein
VKSKKGKTRQRKSREGRGTATETARGQVQATQIRDTNTIASRLVECTQKSGQEIQICGKVREGRNNPRGWWRYYFKP